MIQGTVTYLAIHFIGYVLWIRNVKRFQTEAGVFLYHCVPAFILAIILLLYFFYSGNGSRLQITVVCVCLQGIYNLSFLELWSLAQGGYSVGILTSLENARVKGISHGFESFKSMGEGKKRNRIRNLMALKLVSSTSEGRYTLTPQGRLLARLFRLITWWANTREIG